MDFKEQLKEYQNIVNKELEKYLRKDEVPEKILNNSMEYSLMAGGKRIRPILIMATYQIFKKDIKPCIPYAVSIEMVHLSGYVVGCAAPFPWPEDVEIIVDNEVFNHEKQICSAGLPTESMVVASEDLKKVYSTLPNKVTYVDYPKPEEE